MTPAENKWQKKIDWVLCDLEGLEKMENEQRQKEAESAYITTASLVMDVKRADYNGTIEGRKADGIIIWLEEAQYELQNLAVYHLNQSEAEEYLTAIKTALEYSLTYF